MPKSKKLNEELEEKNLVEDEDEEEDIEDDEIEEEEEKGEGKKEAKTEEEDDDEEGDEATKSLVDKVSTQLAKKFQSKFIAGIERSKFFSNGEAKKGGEEKNITRDFFKALMAGDDVKLKAMTTATNDTPKAGYTIPRLFLAEVLRIAEEAGVARRDMRYLPFSGPGNTRDIPALGTSVSVAWTTEKSKKTATDPVFSLVTQTLKKLTAIAPMTEEILEDSAINLESLLAELFAEAIAVEEDNQFFAGTGAPWTGILNNGSVYTVDMGTGEGFDDLTADDLLDMTAKLKKSMRRNGKFYLSNTVMNVVRKLKDKDDNYIYQQPSGTAPATIWGYQYEEVDAMPDVTDSAAATPFIIFGNLKKCAIFGDKQQIRVKILDQATITDTDQATLNLAEQDAIALRIVERVGYVLAIPKGICVLKSGASS